MGKSRFLGRSIMASAALLLAAPLLQGFDFDNNHFRARMSPFNEVPSVSSTVTGTFTATLSTDETMLTYTLTYANPENPIEVAHIHFGQPGVNGGVIAFLCGGGSKPACPAAPATVTGTIVASDVMGPTAQGFVAGDMTKLVQALRRGFVYANAHTSQFPGGTLRGQVFVTHELGQN